MNYQRILLATHNAGKAGELSQLLAHHNLAHVPVHTLADAPFHTLPPTQERTGAEATFEGNARLKAETVASHHLIPAGTLVLADDSGLCVDALNGAPGVDTAIYAQQNGHTDNNAYLLNQLQGVENRRAHFVCIIAAVLKTQKGISECQFYRGECHGNISTEPRGTEGFGYDPVFEPDTKDSTLPRRTFAQMSPQEKAQYSHRAHALQAWVKDL